MACCFVESAVLRGTEAVPIAVEVEIQRDLPGFTIMGMPDASALEARERVRYAIRSAGYTMPNERIVVNLAPSSLKKRGSTFDLPIALGILVASEQIPREFVEGRLFAGELGIDGRVCPVRGALAYAIDAKEMGLDFVGSAACSDIVDAPDVTALGMENLADVRTGGIRPITAAECSEIESAVLDFKEVRGNEAAKRALQIAAAGGHSVLLVGTPGSGKTMLASCVPSILPPMSRKERFETATIHSAAGEPVDAVKADVRPFRAPHHSVNPAGMVGGGNPIRPGEVSLAHNGVLFLDEIQKFRPAVLQGLRQPMESGLVRIARADGTVEMAAKPEVVIAAANPCPCGCYGDAAHECTCSAQQVRQYQNRLMGPLADLIDIQVDVRRPSPGELLGEVEGASSAELREGVVRARMFAAKRNDYDSRPVSYAEALGRCSFDRETLAFLDKTATARNMSNLDIMRTAKVARTIADLEESYQVKREHLIEALALIPRFGNL